MTVEQALQHVQQGQYDEALQVLATVPDSPQVQAARFVAASTAGRPEAITAAKALLGQHLSQDLSVRIMNWAVVHRHHEVVAQLGQQQLGQRVGDFVFLYQVGVSAREARMYHLSFTCLHQALMMAENKVQRATSYSQLGATAKDFGDTPLAVGYFRQAYEITGDSDALNTVLMSSMYAQLTLAPFYEQVRDYQRFTNTVRPVHRRRAALMHHPEQGLRIGFITGDFISHSLTPLIQEPLRAIAQLGTHKLYFYQNRPHDPKDTATEGYQKMCAGWLNVTGMPAEDVAARMQADGLDVLIDLAGHSAAHRLDVLALQPAPVQIGWICGMMTPCGLETVPYFLADRGMLNAQIRATCPEKLVELDSAYTYFPPSSIPLNTSGPITRLGNIQFGCLNNPCKVNAAVLDAWARILKALPGSTFHLKCGGEDGAKWFVRELGDRGVPARQIVPVLHLPSGLDVQRYYTNTIDIALDPWPCAGMLTTLEAWWMGVPTVTLAGQTFLHNQSVSVLTHVKQQALIAQTVDEYVKIAVALAADRDRLASIRATARAALDASIVRRPADVANTVLSGIYTCWRDWWSTRRAFVSD